MSIFTLKLIYKPMMNDTKNFDHIKDCIKTLDKLGSEFLDALGKCKIFHSLSALLPSRFASTNPNGVWDYSPFFCGAGLAEGLELMYRSVMALWDGMWEPILVLHLHNMLVQEGYLKHAVSLYSGLGLIFSDSFFSGGQPPIGNYAEALHSQISKGSGRKAMLQEKTNRRVVGKATRARDFLNLTPLHLFKQKSSLLMYGSADWDPDRVPDSDIDLMSAMALIRLSQTRRVRDPVTSVWRLEETDLVKQVRAAGMDESFILALDPLFELLRDERQTQRAQMTLSIPDCSSPQILGLYDANKSPKKEENSVDPAKYEITGERMLRMLYNDIRGDVCGGDRRPLSSLNYIGITIQMLQYFEELELESRNSSSTMFKRPSVSNAGPNVQCKIRGDQRLYVTLCALRGKDEELLKSMAIVFERCGGRFIDNIYWSVEDDEAEMSRRSKMEDDSPSCCVM